MVGKAFPGMISAKDLKVEWAAMNLGCLFACSKTVESFPLGFLTIYLWENGELWKTFRNENREERKNVRILKKVGEKCLRFLKKSIILKSVDEHPHKQVKNYIKIKK